MSEGGSEDRQEKSEGDEAPRSDTGAPADRGPASETAPSRRPPEERRYLSYEGAVVPRFLAVLWIAFLVWGIVYLILYVPESMVEWFSRD